ncbi:hypothetical protein LI328DRAFT_96989 [Trichoderma asperelloides]|nr:hypothetical protein LI328DRAFT_96989 [Trichoderma asperelloides]
MLLHPVNACQLFSQWVGTLSARAHNVVRLNNAHRRLSSVWFVTCCPCGCSRLVVRGFQGSEASKALLAGGAIACGLVFRSLSSITVPNLPCVTGAQSPLQQRTNGKPLVREIVLFPGDLTQSHRECVRWIDRRLRQREKIEERKVRVFAQTLSVRRYLSAGRKPIEIR